jgi:hypothetical protein
MVLTDSDIVKSVRSFVVEFDDPLVCPRSTVLEQPNKIKVTAAIETHDNKQTDRLISHSFRNTFAQALQDKVALTQSS